MSRVYTTCSECGDYSYEELTNCNHCGSSRVEVTDLDDEEHDIYEDHDDDGDEDDDNDESGI